MTCEQSDLGAPGSPGIVQAERYDVRGEAELGVERSHQTVGQPHEWRHGVKEGERQKRRLRVEPRRSQ